MKAIRIRIVDSISEEMEQIQNRIRIRAYEKFLDRSDRSDHSDRALEDWLAAERELISILSASIKEVDNHLIAQIEIPYVKPQDLEIRLTTQEVLIYAEVQDESKSDTGTGEAKVRSALGVVRFPVAVDAAGVRAEYSRDILRLTAPISKKTNSFKKSA